jgi:hypothetical protein
MSTTALSETWMIAVDDHLIEPPSVWVDRLPAEVAAAIPGRIIEVALIPMWDGQLAAGHDLPVLPLGRRRHRCRQWHRCGLRPVVHRPHPSAHAS